MVLVVYISFISFTFFTCGAIIPGFSLSSLFFNFSHLVFVFGALCSLN